MDENKWEELSEVQTDYMDSARSEITDDTDISYITVSGKFLTKHFYPKNSDNGAWQFVMTPAWVWVQWGIMLVYEQMRKVQMSIE